MPAFPPDGATDTDAGVDARAPVPDASPDGSVAAANLAISPEMHDFGALAVGSTSPEFVFTVANTGQTASGALTAALASTSNFSIVANGCTSGLAPGATCTVGVSFHPLAAGAATSQLDVAATADRSAHVGVVGTGSAQVTVQNGAGGAVTSDVTGVDCASGATCTATFAVPTVVLTAHPDGAHAFTGWSGGGCRGTGTCSLTLTSATTTVSAAYVGAPTVTMGTPAIDAKNGTASFPFTATAATSVTCHIDAAPPIACTSPFAVTNVAAGRHTLTVTAANAAGSASAPSGWTSDAWVDGVNATTPTPAASATPSGTWGKA